MGEDEVEGGRRERGEREDREGGDGEEEEVMRGEGESKPLLLSVNRRSKLARGTVGEGWVGVGGRVNRVTLASGEKRGIA